MNKWYRFTLDDTDKFWRQWDDLNQLYNQSHPMLDSIFVRGLVRCFGKQIEVLCCKQNNKVIALLLIHQNKFGITQIYSPSQASISLCLIPSSLNPSKLLSTLSFWYFRFDCFYIDPLFQSGMLERNSLMESRVSSINMDILVEGGFEQYWAGRVSSLRKSLRRYMNKIDQDLDDLQFRVIDKEEEVKQAVTDYGALESRGWKGGKGTAVHPDNSQGHFYQEIMYQFAAIDKAKVFELRLGKRLVASRLCIFNAHQLIVLKTTYDEQFKSYAFGRILLYKVLSYIFENKLSKRVDFYTNATKDQLRWATNQRPLYHVSVYSRLLGRFCIKPIANLKSKCFQADVKSTNIELGFSYNFDNFSHEDLEIFESASTPFTSYDWVENFAENVACRLGTVVYLTLKIDSQTKALLPLIEQKQQGIKILSCFSNYYTPYIDLICEKGQKAEYFRMIVEYGASYFCKFDRINILPVTSNQLEVISPAIKRLGFVEEQYLYSKNWRELDIRSYDQFASKIASRLQSTIKRKKKKITPETGFQVKEITSDDAEQLIRDYQRVYERSWKVNEPFPKFIEQLLKRCQRAGQSRLYVMYHFSEPVAAQFWIVEGSRAYIYKLAHDPQYSNLSVGTVLSDHIFHDVITRDRVNEIDYLIGNDNYKNDWMSNSRPLYGLCAYNKKSFFGQFFILRKTIKIIKNRVMAKRH